MIRKTFYQNTGFGWWSEGEIAECLRIPGGVTVRKQIS